MAKIRILPLLVVGLALASCGKTAEVSRNINLEPLVDIAPAIAPMPSGWLDDDTAEAALEDLTSQWVTHDHLAADGRD
ncbi:hypothetical protein [Arenibacterium sp. LLYu02]|uniref:hypothetical protein n=1 Tax=Arenibacterium sp. LLYu02 TaxID=3404132 RepID=UPI003B221164